MLLQWHSFIFEDSDWDDGKDIRTLWRQQLWSCFSLPPAPSLQCVWVEGEGREWAGVFASIYISIVSEKSLLPQLLSAREKDALGRSRDGERNRLLQWEVPQQHFLRYSDWFPLCTSAVGAKPGFHPQTPKQQTAASGNTLIQVYYALCLFLSVSSHHTPRSSPHSPRLFSHASCNLLVV